MSVDNNSDDNWMSSWEDKLGIKNVNEINAMTGYERTIHSIRRYSILACISWWFCWLIIPLFLALIFQVILVFKTLELKEDKSKLLYLILSIIGIIWVGAILDIIIAIKSEMDIVEYNKKQSN